MRSAPGRGTKKQVRERLVAKGIDLLLPTYTRLRQWKDRKKKIEVSLFPCYCFARFSLAARLPVMEVPGVIQIVGGGNRPEPIPDEEINALRALMKSTLPYDVHPYLHEGMLVQVIRGPLEGVRGILMQKAKPFRLVISVNLIRHSAAVAIDAADVEPV